MNFEWTELLRALALVMVIEGLMPFAAPSQWRRTLFTIAQLENRSMRMIGFASMAAGLAVLQFV
ncbi:DUF2065 domain-containing protein [Solimonas variicoloris]|uniref:DUF2065 domain-containing protein n=1 Tax=Solimonas variicoloris TaxID=254408 RepID=UPI000367ACBC|nr:DUF2065 domain-containing protein [Solimonas variicoloris]